MNKSFIKSQFKIAAAKALSKEDEREYLLGAVGIRSDGVTVYSLNASCMNRMRSSHAEYKLLKKCNAGATIFVARIRMDGHYGMARPCHHCSKLIRTKRVHCVYYTINSNQYGVWLPNEDRETVYNLNLL